MNNSILVVQATKISTYSSAHIRYLTRHRFIMLLFILLSTCTAILGDTKQSLMAAPEQEDCEVAERLGYGETSGASVNYDNPQIAALKAGWFLDWRISADPQLPSGCTEYVQVLRVRQHYYVNEDGDNIFSEPHTYTISATDAKIAAVAQARPGSVWLLGNEIDRFGQNPILPELYAEVYHHLYHVIKKADPTAQVANGSIIQATPLRLEYLTKVWDTYQERYGEAMPVDVWNVHNFIIQEVRNVYGADIPPGFYDVDEGITYPDDMSHIDMDIFAQQTVAMRQWMKDRGQQNKPLIVSEYGVLYWHCTRWEDPDTQETCLQTLFDIGLVIDFMIQSFDYYLNAKDCEIGYPEDECRLVQRWNWYALNHDGSPFGFNPYTYLYDHQADRLSHTGAAFQAYTVANMGQLAFPAHTTTTTPTPAETAKSTPTVTATVTATVTMTPSPIETITSNQTVALIMATSSNRDGLYLSASDCEIY